LVLLPIFVKNGVKIRLGSVLSFRPAISSCYFLPSDGSKIQIFDLKWVKSLFSNHGIIIPFYFMNAIFEDEGSISSVN